MLSFVVRALVLFVSIELSGLAGIAVELAELDASGASDCCSDCPLEKEGRECPPGCPNCHCSHGGVALPPVLSTAFTDAFELRTSVPVAPAEAAAPRAPILPGVYRPPRPAPTFA